MSVPTPRSVLVVATQRLGDVLLATPLIRSIRAALPSAKLDALVFSDTVSVLEANSDVDDVITIARRPSLREHLDLVGKLWKKYDLSFSTGPGDRPTLYACVSAGRRIGSVAPGAKHAWKRRWLSRFAVFDDLDTHTVTMNLRLADLAGIPRAYEVRLGFQPRDAEQVDTLLGGDVRPRAVLHVSPKFEYKAWHSASWIELARWLAGQGLAVILTGGDDAHERAAVAAVCGALGTAGLNLAGKLSLPQVACLLERARLFVGPDTVVTHIAAAMGTPTIALFGPSNPVKWGPWPRTWQADPSPFARHTSQRVGNVWLLQGVKPCVPCMLVGCDRHIVSESACLKELPATRVIDAARQMLAENNDNGRR
jgi:heptosyltransferase-3